MTLRKPTRPSQKATELIPERVLQDQDLIALEQESDLRKRLEEAYGEVDEDYIRDALDMDF